MDRPEKPRYVLTLEALADPTPATIRLRRALKHLGRWFGLRVVRLEELPPDAPDRSAADQMNSGTPVENPLNRLSHPC
jgi:hypothetical protein